MTWAEIDKFMREKMLELCRRAIRTKFEADRASGGICYAHKDDKAKS